MFKQVQTEQLQLSMVHYSPTNETACLARVHLRMANDADVLVPPVWPHHSRPPSGPRLRPRPVTLCLVPSPWPLTWPWLSTCPPLWPWLSTWPSTWPGSSRTAQRHSWYSVLLPSCSLAAIGCLAWIRTRSSLRGGRRLLNRHSALFPSLAAIRCLAWIGTLSRRRQRIRND